MIDINFSYLFKVEVLHEYFSGLVCNDINIVPSADTIKTMNGYKMLSKVDGNLLVVGIQSTSSLNSSPPSQFNFTPFILPANGTRFTFYIYYSNPLFFNFTEIPLSVYTPGSIFYFTNRNTNSVSSPDKLFLTAPINSSLPAGLGDLYVNSDNIVYQSLIPANNTAPASPLDILDWRQTDTNRFATTTDIVLFLPMVSTYTLPPLLTPLNTPLTIKLFGYQVVGGVGTYNNQVFTKTLTFPGPVSEFHLDLSSLTPGKYNLQLSGAGNTVNQFIYLDDGLTNSDGLLGVIDIYSESTLSSDYLLLNSNNFLQSPLYSICFLNRASYWNYNLLPPPNPGGTISDSNGVVSFAALPLTPPVILQSTIPIPVTDRPSNKFTLALASSPVQTVSNIPCATPGNLSTAYNSAFYNSEIYLNY